MKQRLLEIKAKRQDQALENLSDEELDKMIAGCSGSMSNDIKNEVKINVAEMYPNIKI